jgi:hypothetical protein
LTTPFRKQKTSDFSKFDGWTFFESSWEYRSAQVAFSLQRQQIYKNLLRKILSLKLFVKLLENSGRSLCGVGKTKNIDKSAVERWIWRTTQLLRNWGISAGKESNWRLSWRFNSSDGWLEYFKQRNPVLLQKVAGKMLGNVLLFDLREGKDIFPSILSHLERSILTTARF